MTKEVKGWREKGWNANSEIGRAIMEMVTANTLSTENGICATNEIYLEPEVLRILVGYCKRKGILADDRPQNPD